MEKAAKKARKAIDRQAGLGTSAPKEGVDVERLQLQETFLLEATLPSPSP